MVAKGDAGGQAGQHRTGRLACREPGRSPRPGAAQPPRNCERRRPARKATQCSHFRRSGRKDYRNSGPGMEGGGQERTPVAFKPAQLRAVRIGWATGECDSASERARVLDLGTGCGAIALAVAAERPGARVVATDIDPASIALCRRNADRLGLAVESRVADVFEGLTGRFDVIVSNPPYVDDDDAHLDRGDLRFEPRGALLGGANGGLDFIARLVREAPDHVLRGGWLCIEHGHDQGAPVAGLFASRGFRDIQGRRDDGGRPRVTVGRWGRARRENTLPSE